MAEINISVIKITRDGPKLSLERLRIPAKCCPQEIQNIRTQNWEKLKNRKYTRQILSSKNRISVVILILDETEAKECHQGLK